MYCSIASVTSYLSGSEAKNLQNGDVHIAQIRDFEMKYLEIIWRIEVGDGSFFCIFRALSFELNFFFDRRFPLRTKTYVRNVRLSKRPVGISLAKLVFGGFSELPGHKKHLELFMWSQYEKS